MSARHIGLARYERGPHQQGYADGYKPKIVKSRVGALDLTVSQAREGDFYPPSLERGLRSEQTLKLALARRMSVAYRLARSRA